MANNNFDRLLSRSVYGLIITATLLFTLESHESSAWDMAVTISLTILAVSTAEYYAHLFHKHSRKTSIKDLFSEIITDSFSMILGSALSILLFILAGFGIITILAAFNLAELSIALFSMFAGYYYGKSSGKSNKIASLYGLANLGLVLIILSLELWAHHQRL